LDAMVRLNEGAFKQASRLQRVPKSTRRAYLRARHQLARTWIKISLLVRSIDFNAFEKKRLIDKVRQDAERLETLKREADRLERRASVARSDNAAAARKELGARRAEIRASEERAKSGRTN